MKKFHASAVEVSTDEGGILVVHFDDQDEHYLQLQAPEIDDPDEHEEGYGNVHVEVDDQLHSGYNCFSLAELTRGSFRLVLDRDKDMMRIGKVQVTFDIDDAAFSELRRGLSLAFRSFGNFVKRFLNGRRHKQRGLNAFLSLLACDILGNDGCWVASH